MAIHSREDEGTMTEGILSRLIEKKDILVYLKVREKELEAQLHVIVSLPPRQRETTKRQIVGRLREVKSFRKLANENKFKSTAIELWKTFGTHRE